MYKQMKYAARQGLELRLWALAAVVVLNVVFGVLGAAGVYGPAGRITAVALSGLALCGLFAITVVADVQSLRSLFSAPGAYMTLLAPVPARKILLGRIIPMAVMDLIGLAAGIAGVVIQALLLANAPFSWLSFEWIESIWPVFGLAAVWATAIYAVVNYLLFIVSICFALAMVKSVFFRAKGKGFLGVVSFFTAHGLLSLLNLPLLAVAPHNWYGPAVTVEITAGFNAGMGCCLIVLFLQTFILFRATAHLMDRRINL